MCYIKTQGIGHSRLCYCQRDSWDSGKAKASFISIPRVGVNDIMHVYQHRSGGWASDGKASGLGRLSMRRELQLERAGDVLGDGLLGDDKFPFLSHFHLPQRVTDSSRRICCIVDEYLRYFIKTTGPSLST